MQVDPGRSEGEVLAALASAPDLAALARPGAAVLILSRDGERALFASRAARVLVSTAASPDGRLADVALRSSLGGAARLAGASGGLVFSRLRLSGTPFASRTTCAFRQVALASGDTGLLAILPGAAPKRRRRGGFAESEAPADVAGPSNFSEKPADANGRPAARNGSESAGITSPRSVAHGRGRDVRFTWEADTAARITSVSPALAAAVGTGNAAIVGRTWRDLEGDLIADDAGVTDLIARQQTWNGRTVRWRIAETSDAVAVDLAGTPTRGPDGTVKSFRGFGLVRLDKLTRWTPAVLPTGQQIPLETTGVLPLEAKGDVADEAAERAGDIVSFVPAKGVPSGQVPEPEGAAWSSEDGEARSGSREHNDGASGPGERTDAVDPATSKAVGASAAELHARPLESSAAPVKRGVDDARPASASQRLSHAERAAFRDIARALGARLEDPVEADREPAPRVAPAKPVPFFPERARAERVRPAPLAIPDARTVLERLPVGVLVHRGEEPLFANRALLEWLGYESVEAMRAAGGVARLFGGRAGPQGQAEGGLAPVRLTDSGGAIIPADLHLATVEWGGASASVLTVRRMAEDGAGPRLQALELELRARDARASELAAILDTATDGVVVLDEAGRILSLNRSAEALFGYDRNEVAGDPLAVLLAPESHAAALEYLEGLRTNGVRSLLNDGREVVGRVRQGGSIPLSMTLGRVGEGPVPKFCAVLRDVTALEKARGELAAAKRAAETASARKADVLAKVSHEVRTPLNAIIGFAEVMLEERFGPVGNERYRDYLQDIHGSGRRVVSLVDDLLDLARIEAGRMDLSFASVGLNGIVAASVAGLQPLAARERIVVRTSFAARLPGVVADERSLRQIVTNLVSNAIRFTEAGGQVIVSTAVTDRGEVAFRVRDTGVGMSAEEVEAALEPFRPIATARAGGGAGLGLPLTKALVEANRAALHITSARREGTLAEVLFPSARVLAE